MATATLIGPQKWLARFGSNRRNLHCSGSLSSLRLIAKVGGISFDKSIGFPKAGAVAFGVAVYGVVSTGIYFGYKKYKEKSRLTALCTPLEPNPFVRAKLDLCVYKDTVVTTESVTSGLLERVASLVPRASDLVVASFPKSGTTWLQEIVLQLKNDNRSLETSFPYLEFVYPGLKSIEQMNEPRLLKTHLPVHLLPNKLIESGAKVLYIYRNPKDVAVSYFHFATWLAFINYVGEFDAFAADFMNERLPYAPYFSHLLGYLELSENHPDQVLVLCYEDLQTDLGSQIRRVAEFLGIKDFNDVEVAKKCSFEAMKRNPRTNYEHWNDLGIVLKGRSEFMRKGKVGDFKNYFRSSATETNFDQWVKKGEETINERLLKNQNNVNNKEKKSPSFTFKYDVKK